VVISIYDILRAVAYEATKAMVASVELKSVWLTGSASLPLSA
jgi:hypothetical protein